MNPLPRQIALDLGHTPEVTLENFIVTGNENLISVLKNIQNAWQQNLSGSTGLRPDQRMIHFWGASGSGRSHLLAAMKTKASELGIHIFLLNHESTPDEWRIAGDSLLENSLEVGLLGIDDIDHLDDFAQGALFRLHNAIRESEHQYLLTSSLNPITQLQLRDDLKTRLAWGLVFQMHVLSDDEKLQALQLSANARGLNLSPEVPQWLLRHFHRDMPSLMSLLDALDTYSLETKRAITLPLVKEMLAQKNKHNDA